jgi:ABC-type multidrug transport system ATPase subunit
MDPMARQKLWEVIRTIKQGKIILLTTHNMEEADYLGGQT